MASVRAVVNFRTIGLPLIVQPGRAVIDHLTTTVRAGQSLDALYMQTVYVQAVVLPAIPSSISGSGSNLIPQHPTTLLYITRVDRRPLLSGKETGNRNAAECEIASALSRN